MRMIGKEDAELERLKVITAKCGAQPLNPPVWNLHDACALWGKKQQGVVLCPYLCSSSVALT